MMIENDTVETRSDVRSCGRTWVTEIVLCYRCGKSTDEYISLTNDDLKIAGNVR